MALFMKSIPNNSQNLNQTRPHPTITDRMLPSMNPNNRSHITIPESQSISADGVGRVRSQFLEFGNDYLHKQSHLQI
jgi:hypothetical protein